MNPILPIDILVPLLLIGGAAMLALAWRSTAAAAMRHRAAALAVRAVVVAGLAVIALNPGRWMAPPADTDSEWALLIDRSASMQTADAGGRPRWEEAVRLARSAAAAADPASPARPATFTDRLESALGDTDTALTARKPDGSTTDICRSLEDLLDRSASRRQRLAGVILLTDGRQRLPTPPETAALRARGLAAPVYALVLGGEVRARDLSLTPVRRYSAAFQGHELRLRARVQNQNMGDVRPTLRLRAPDGRELAAAAVALTNNQTVTAGLALQPEGAGYREYTLALDPLPGEAAADNNTATIGVNVLGHQIRVLVAEGAPHWDTKFLVQHLRRQPHISATTVHRLSADRFFRIAAGAAEGAETTAVFPDTEEELNRYDLVVFGRGADYFLTGDRVGLLRRFVRERGGGVLFARGNPSHGALAELADLQPVEWAGDGGGAARWMPTADGAALELFGPVLPAAEDAIWTRLPPVRPAAGVARLQPFATVLVSPDGAGRGTPFVVSRRVGRGVTVACNADDLWRWDFFPTSEEASRIYKDFWTELIQWMAIHGDFLPGQDVALRLSAASARPDEPVKAIVQRRGTDGAAGAPPLQLFAGDRMVQELRLQASGGRSNEWSAVFSLAEPGTYRVEAGEAQTVLRVARPPSETEDASADPAFLAKLTELSGGRVITEAELANTARSFKPEDTRTTEGEPVWAPWWNRAWLLSGLLALLAGEWFWRRRSGLM